MSLGANTQLQRYLSVSHPRQDFSLGGTITADGGRQAKDFHLIRKLVEAQGLIQALVWHLLNGDDNARVPHSAHTGSGLKAIRLP